MKCVFKSLSVNGKSFKVMKNSEWNEYITKFYRNDSHEVEANYHTDDKQDAIDTGVSFQMRKEVNHECN